MSKTIPTRHCIRVLLINNDDEILLLRTVDSAVTRVDGRDFGPFWSTPGGGIEEGETLIEAASRELFEEAGFTKNEVTFEQVVWYGDYELIVRGARKRMKHQFIVARTEKTSVCFENQTENEKAATTHATWLSVDDLIKMEEMVFPFNLALYLPSILRKDYPKEIFRTHLEDPLLT